MRALVLAVHLCLTGCAHASEPRAADTSIELVSGPGCSYDLGAMMRLDYDEFENDLDGGWRPLGSTPGCEAETANLIRIYRTDRIEVQQRSLLHHEAQLLGAAGDYAAASATLRSLIPLVVDPVMQHYHDAELAFFERDYDALLAARSRLASVPPPEGFEKGVEQFQERFPDSPPPVWPINLDVVDGLIACFDRPYSEAYSDACRPAPQTPAP